MPSLKIISIHRCPAHLSPAQFQQKMEAFTDAIVAVPCIQKHALKFETVPN
jgi:hypothetical protein